MLADRRKPKPCSDRTRKNPQIMLKHRTARLLRASACFKDDAMTRKPTLSGPATSLSTRKVADVRKFDSVTLDQGLTSVASLRDWLKDRGIASTTGPVLLVSAAGMSKADGAKAIATDLGLPLQRIDLAGIVSKYIGETEAALDRLFDAAACSGAALLFDEADDLFGKRTSVDDAHDRYAGIDTAHLLDRMARYSGTLLITSANKTNLDPAFLRRMRHVVELPKPGGTR